MVYFLAILIIIDLTATLFWVHNGLATEANPIMDFFLQYSPVLLHGRHSTLMGIQDSVNHADTMAHAAWPERCGR